MKYLLPLLLLLFGSPAQATPLPVEAEVLNFKIGRDNNVAPALKAISTLLHWKIAGQNVIFIAEPPTGDDWHVPYFYITITIENITKDAKGKMMSNHYSFRSAKGKTLEEAFWELYNNNKGK